jgi:hypothetical protein
MNEVAPLCDYSRSRAVLIGAWDYVHLAPVPAAHNSLERMSGLLTGPLCGWPRQQVEVVRNPRRRDRLPDRLMELFDAVEDVALFYFVGHGQLYEDELCLALRESPAAGPRRTTVGLPFSDVRATLRACDAQTKIVILDCCFAGRATQPDSTLASTATMVIDRTLGTGAVTLAASGAYRTAWFESAPGVAAPQTYFTKYLIDVIERGIPGYPRGLPLGPIYARTADSLARDRRPEPTRSVRHDADRFILARNAAEPAVPGGLSPATPTASLSVTRDATPPTAPALLGTAPDGSDAVAGPATAHRRPRRRSVVLGGLGALVAASATAVGIRLADGQDPGTGDSSRAPSASGDGTSSSAAPVPRLWFTLTDPTGRINSVTLSRDGGTLADAGEDASIRLWNVAARARARTLTGHTAPVSCVVFSPGGKTLASGSVDNTVRLWRVAEREPPAVLTGHSGSVNAVTYSPDGTTLASAADDHTVRLWNHAPHVVLTGHTGGVRSVAFSPDSRILASGSDDTRILLWDVADQKQTAALSGHASAVMSLAFSHDGSTLASAGDQASVLVWDLATRKHAATLAGHTGPVTSVAYSPDGGTLASGSQDTTVRMWDVTTWKHIATLTGHTGAVTSVTFSHDGTVLAGGGADGTIRLWRGRASYGP